MLSPLATAYDTKCRRVDAQALPEVCEDGDPSADLLHIYGPLPPRRVLREIAVPYVSESAPPPSRLPWRMVRPPAAIARPEDMPEAVEDAYRDSTVVAYRSGEVHRIGSYLGQREGVASMIDQTLARIHRFRQDVEWLRFDAAPSPSDLRSLALWVDPLTRQDDMGGFVAEAIVSGCLTVAGRTSVNERRLDGGKAGFLVPLRDPNELAHAIVNALFREEESRSKRQAMTAAAGRFAPLHRVRALIAVYEKALAR